MDKGRDVDGLTLSVDSCARLLQIGRGSCYEGVRTGQIPSIRIGRRILIPKAALERLLSGEGGNINFEQADK